MTWAREGFPAKKDRKKAMLQLMGTHFFTSKSACGGRQYVFLILRRNACDDKRCYQSQTSLKFSAWHIKLILTPKATVRRFNIRFQGNFCPTISIQSLVNALPIEYSLHRSQRVIIPFKEPFWLRSVDEALQWWSRLGKVGAFSFS